ncbi:MAG: hypothetical protein EOP38_09790 [Rubrivivax sp.]|nr:MAG: hypothetical protein EOP38_09790 [Rubrivivax sp.]
MKPLLIASLLLVANTAFAANRVLLESPITYADNAGVVDRIRQECGIENMLETRVGRVLEGLNKGGDSTIAAGTKPADATVLRLQITNVMGVGGGAWSGPKSITVSADLIDNGKVTRHTRFSRATTGGAFGGFKGTCALLERCAATIGKDLGRWIKDPAYSVPEEAAPAKDEAPASAASGG